MIDNLTEAITHCKEKAKELRKKAIDDYANDKTTLAEFADCRECASEHEQLAALLEELAERRETDRWIPVSERLPEYDGNYLVTFGNGFIDTAPYSTLTLGFGLFREVIDENNKCIGEDFDYWDVIAWRP